MTRQYIQSIDDGKAQEVELPTLWTGHGFMSLLAARCRPIL